jgi:hypothetical protein
MALALSLAVVAVSAIGLLAVLLRVEALGRRERSTRAASGASAVDVEAGVAEAAAPSAVSAR